MLCRVGLSFPRVSRVGRDECQNLIASICTIGLAKSGRRGGSGGAFRHTHLLCVPFCILPRISSVDACGSVWSLDRTWTGTTGTDADPRTPLSWTRTNAANRAEEEAHLGRATPLLREVPSMLPSLPSLWSASLSLIPRGVGLATPTRSLPIRYVGQEGACCVRQIPAELR